jgi:hypothetical protein
MDLSCLPDYEHMLFVVAPKLEWLKIWRKNDRPRTMDSLIPGSPVAGPGTTKLVHSKYLPQTLQFIDQSYMPLPLNSTLHFQISSPHHQNMYFYSPTIHHRHWMPCYMDIYVYISSPHYLILFYGQRWWKLIRNWHFIYTNVTSILSLRIRRLYERGKRVGGQSWLVDGVWKMGNGKRIYWELASWLWGLLDMAWCTRSGIHRRWRFCQGEHSFNSIMLFILLLGFWYGKWTVHSSGPRLTWEQRGIAPGQGNRSRPLWPASHGHTYPTRTTIHSWKQVRYLGVALLLSAKTSKQRQRWTEDTF